MKKDVKKNKLLPQKEVIFFVGPLIAEEGGVFFATSRTCKKKQVLDLFFFHLKGGATIFVRSSGHSTTWLPTYLQDQDEDCGVP